MELTVGGRTINLDAALPLTLGDWRALRKNGITMALLGTLFLEEPDKGALFLLHVLRKADNAATEADVDSLSMGRIATIVRAINAAEEADLDRPFLTPSTSSPGPTGGPGTI